jgi:hypothetical protein
MFELFGRGGPGTAEANKDGFHIFKIDSTNIDYSSDE